jgi:hypothetical protein
MLTIVAVQKAISEKLTELGMTPCPLNVSVKKMPNAAKREGDSNEQKENVKRAKGEPPSTPTKTGAGDDIHDNDIAGVRMDIFDEHLAGLAKEAEEKPAIVKMVFVVVIEHVQAFVVVVKMVFHLCNSHIIHHSYIMHT